MLNKHVACSTCAHEYAARVAIIEDLSRIVEHTPLPDHIVLVAVVFYVFDVARGVTIKAETRVVEVGGSGGKRVDFLKSRGTNLVFC